MLSALLSNEKKRPEVQIRVHHKEAADTVVLRGTEDESSPSVAHAGRIIKGLDLLTSELKQNRIVGDQVLAVVERMERRIQFLEHELFDLKKQHPNRLRLLPVLPPPSRQPVHPKKIGFLDKIFRPWLQRRG